MLSVRGHDELRAAALAVKAADRDLRKMIYAAMREKMSPVWRSVVAANATTALDSRLIDSGVLVKAGNPPVLQAGASKRKAPGTRLVPDRDWAGAEYGANRADFTRYTRKSTKGTVHQVERRTMRHLRPRRRSGYVLGPAVADIGPRLASLAVQAVVKTYMDVLDRKGR